MPNLEEMFIQNYGYSETLRAAEPPLRICPIGAYFDYQNGRLIGMTIDVSVDMIYSSREVNYVQIQSKDFPDKEIFSYGQDLEYIPGFWGNYIRGMLNPYNKIMY
ncbi:hypothetical protein ACN68H_06990 [Aerococcus viridans]